ncbi:MAG: recombinase family protein [Lachnospiraceae bacterium]
MDEYYLYLRKSRADYDAEMHGAGETLKRHETELLKLAKSRGLNVTKIFREIVSGETIAARPEMQKLLEEVRLGNPTGVLVMEIERLARGDTKDQGTVAEAFKSCNVKIITPVKTYDPNNEFDEEYFEFGLFMSRREYKTINRRIQRGRLASVQEGKYIASTAPYGYERVRIKNDKGWTLKIIPDQAEIVRLIYKWYTRGELNDDGSRNKFGMHLICKKLDSMHVKPPYSHTWSRATIKAILTNPAYIGKLRWQWRKVEKDKHSDQIKEHYRTNHECLVVDGLHEAIIDEKSFEIARYIMQSHSYPSITSNKVLQNPLSGIVYCGMCGRMLTRVSSNTRAGYHNLMCQDKYCKCVSSPLYVVEDKLLDGLKDWLEKYKVEWNLDSSNDSTTISAKKSALELCEKDLKVLHRQLENTYDFLEQGVYTTEIFLSRNSSLNEQIKKLCFDIKNMKKDIELEVSREEIKHSLIPKIENILEIYHGCDNVQLKNDLLKEVLERAEYRKTTPNKKGQRDNANFDLVLYPRLPKS